MRRYSAVLLLALAACGSQDSITGPASEPQAAVAPAAAPPPAPAAPAPQAEDPALVFSFAKDGAMTVSNTRAAAVEGRVCVYEYGRSGFANQELVGEYPFLAPIGVSVTPFPVGRFTPTCGSYVFQLDAVRADISCPKDPFTLGGTGFFKGRAGIEVFNDACVPPPPPPPPQTCELPSVEVLSWQGKGDPATECAAFGDYVPVEADPLFWICKAGNDREVWLTEPTGESCRNGKDISHTVPCGCAP